MKIVVIGGSGLIGKKLVNNLRQRGHDVVACDAATEHQRVRGECRCSPQAHEHRGQMVRIQLLALVFDVIDDRRRANKDVGHRVGQAATTLQIGIALDDRDLSVLTDRHDQARRDERGPSTAVHEQDLQGLGDDGPRHDLDRDQVLEERRVQVYEHVRARGAPAVASQLKAPEGETRGSGSSATIAKV